MADASTAAPHDSLRILLTSFRSHPQMGGQGVYVRELSRALVDLGHQVTVVSGPPYPELSPDIRLEKLPSLELPADADGWTAFRPRLLASWPDLAEWWLHTIGASGEIYAFGERLKAWLASRRDAFDVVHDNQTLFASLPRLGLPTIATLHHPVTVDLKFALAAEPNPGRRGLLMRRHGFLVGQARAARSLPVILTVSEASKAAIVAAFGVDPARIRIASCGVDHGVFRERPDLVRDPNLVASTVSSDVPHKGLIVLIEAMASVVRRFPDARLQLVGELREGPAKAAIARLGLADRVIHSGWMNPPQMAGLFARAGVVVTPSLFEGFGLPAAEALACGAAVVVTDGGALPEVVGHAGLVARAGEAESLAEAIARLLGDEALRAELGREGAARAQRFSWRDHALAAVAAYRLAGAGTRPP